MFPNRCVLCQNVPRTRTRDASALDVFHRLRVLVAIYPDLLKTNQLTAVEDILRYTETLQTFWFSNTEGVRRARCVLLGKLKELLADIRVRRPDLVPRTERVITKLLWTQLPAGVGQQLVGLP